MSKIIQNFKNISYGPAPEDSKDVMSWINSLNNPNHLFINGSWVKSKSSKKINVINPATNKKLTSLSMANKADVNSAVGAAKNKHIKAILGVGDLETLRNVAKASMVCMMAGADFIKTSTGKESINANLNNSLVMLRMIREFYQMTGKKIGFKPAGGISTAKTVIEFLILVMEELGHDWINPKYLRIGASSLLIDIERQLYHFALGRYANKEKLAIG